MFPGCKLCTGTGEGKDRQERDMKRLRAAGWPIGDFWDAVSGKFKKRDSIISTKIFLCPEISLPINLCQDVGLSVPFYVDRGKIHVL
jgi:hypothetical protein